MRQRGKEKASKGHAGEGSKFPLGWAARGSVVHQQRLPLPVTLKGVAKKIHFPHPEWKAKKKKKKTFAALKDLCSPSRSCQEAPGQLGAGAEHHQEGPQSPSQGGGDTGQGQPQGWARGWGQKSPPAGLFCRESTCPAPPILINYHPN